MSIFDEPAMRPLGAVGERYWDNVSLISSPPTLEDIMFLQVAFAHTGMPYREVELGKSYVRRNGSVSIALSPGFLMNQKLKRLEMQGLPFGSIPRLLMLHICHEAKRWGNPLVDMNRSMSSFIREDLGGKSTGGGPRGALTILKDQMNRLAATHMTIGLAFTGGVSTVRPGSPFIEYRVWDEESLKNRPMWKTEVLLSDKFFESVIEQSIPIDMRAIQGLKSSPMCLDLYFNLTQRLYRIPGAQVQRVTWEQLWAQYGQDYVALKRFKQAANENLKRVLKFYADANITEIEGGLEFRQSPPPVPKAMSARKLRLMKGDKKTTQGNLNFSKKSSGPDPMVGVWKRDKQ